MNSFIHFSIMVYDLRITLRTEKKNVSKKMIVGATREISKMMTINSIKNELSSFYRSS